MIKYGIKRKQNLCDAWDPTPHVVSPAAPHSTFGFVQEIQKWFI